ncbi:MAG: hypothetical protein GY850_11075, partial [bacterium]|nr:hypothetical protein [bacterium]
AFRFFPLMEHDELGLTLHPFDLATNKALALVGRLEVRDWIDLIQCHSRIQNTGYLMWAACGKDPGFNPALILAEARRSSHYTQADVAELAFHGDPPDLRKLSVEWKRMLLEAEEFIELLPPERIGACVLDADGHLFKGDPASLRNAIEKKTIRFHSGTLRGAFPSFSV